MGTYEITYKNLANMFGDNVFTRLLKGKTPERALSCYAMENGFTGLLIMVDYKKISEE